MKSIRYILLLLAGSLATSCSDVLNLKPEDFYGINNYWNTAEQCDRFVTGLHFRLRSKATTFFFMGELRGGLFSTSSTTSSGEGAFNIETVRNNLSLSHPGLTGWGGFYGDIYQINHAIEKITDACPFLTEVARKTYLGELYGMRAYYYFHLLRTWGGVPLCDKPDVLMTGDISKLRKPRSTEQEIWQFIREDVDRSCEMFKDQDFVDVKGEKCYWNKAASYCLRAEVYLWGAKVKPLKGTSVFSSDPQADLREAEQSLSAVERLYSPAVSFSAALFPANKNASTETVFALRYHLGEASNFFGTFTYNANTFLKHFDAAGTPLTQDPLNIGSGFQRYEYKLDFYTGIDSADTRKEATFLGFYNNTEFDKKNNPIGDFYLAGTVLRKFLGDVDPGTNRVTFTADWPVYRYADVALLLAEVDNELGLGPQVEKWIEKVRARAYGGTDPAPFTYTSRTEAEEAILAERNIEFVGEGKRWYDIRRMLGGKYALALVDNNELKLVWPIDTGVLSKDNLVEQNEGYVVE